MNSADARLVAPSPALADCIRGYVIRDARDLPVDAPAHATHFPASASCGLSWLLQGGVSREPEGPMSADPLVLRGPQSRPVTRWHRGPLHWFIALLMPDALQALCGVPASALLNRTLPASAMLPADWQTWLACVQGADDDDERIHRIEAFLLPRWRAAKPPTTVSVRYYEPWTRAVGLRAESSAAGRSTRHHQRLVRRWTGQSLRTLRGLARAEQGLMQALARAARHPQGRIDWAGLALAAGYADQAHLCREVRRLTGFSPQELLRQLFTNDAMWVYRLWC